MKIEWYHTPVGESHVEIIFSDEEIYKYRELNLHQLITKDHETIIRYLCYIADKIHSDDP
jgi:hypothetical protein